MSERSIRVGIGYDAHCLVRNRKLMLGGVHIPFEKGLLGHSDADVLLHALADAILGALGLGDIGRHFPDTAEENKDLPSVKILEYIRGKINELDAVIDWIDVVVIAQRPRIGLYMDSMKATIAEALHIPDGRINIKATTTEGMGFAGREEGIASEAVVTIRVPGK
jgi:2-C-methyl-D-erythritol 2,4-cyclodiphosphate synthase